MHVLLEGIKAFLTTSEILIGLVVALGLIVMRKSFSDIIISTAKTILGLIILNAGISLIFPILMNLSPLMQNAFHMKGLVPDTPSWPGVALATGLGTSTSIILLGGFIVNLILARITPLKYIFLTGQAMLWGAIIVSVFLESFGLPMGAVIIIGSIYLGLSFVVLPAINQKYMREITGEQPIAMGHYGATGFFVAGWLGEKFGNKEKTTEDIKLPANLEFAKETTVLAGLIIVLMFIVCGALAEPGFIVNELGVQQNIAVWTILQGLTFGAGLIVVIYGVRMMVAEIIPAFEGIATKVVPDATPALDCPVIYPFAPIAVMIGFLVATISAFVGSAIIGVIFGVVVVPPILQCFFMGGAGAVFGNATGGRRGAILGAIANGLMFVAIPPIFYYYSQRIVSQPLAMADEDLCWLGIILGFIHNLFT
jgi:PTS system ascorbate-specific IIC component